MWATRGVGRGVPRGRDRESWGKENARAWRGAGGGGAGGRTLSPSHRPSPDVAHAGCTFHARSLISARLRQFGEIGEIGGIGVVVKVGGRGGVRRRDPWERCGSCRETRVPERERRRGHGNSAGREGRGEERRSSEEEPHRISRVISSGESEWGRSTLFAKTSTTANLRRGRARESAGAANRRSVRADLRRDLWN